MQAVAKTARRHEMKTKSATRSAVEMHHGAVRVYSTEGEGTTFTIRIPLRYDGSVLINAAAHQGRFVLLYYFIGTKGNFGANGLYDSDILKSLIIEIVLTFVFVFTIMGVTAKKENAPTTGLVIGLSLTLVHILGIYFTGTSVNPARSFGPAMFAGGDALKYVWVFLVAPLIGGALAAFAYKWLSANKE